MPYDLLAQELFDVMDPEKHRPPNRRMDQVMRGEMAVMRLLEAESAPLPAGEISKKLCMTTARVAAVLGSLEKKGLAQRGEDPQDKRRVMVEITQAGRDFNAQRRMEVLGSMRGMLMQLGEADAREYVRLTRRAIEIMQAQREGGTP